MGKFFVFRRIKLKLCSWLYIKKTLTHVSKVSVRKKTSNKKVIAKKPLTNLYEMNSNFSVELRGEKNPRVETVGRHIL